MEWPQNPPQSPGLLLLDSLQNKFHFSTDLKFTLNSLLPRVWITADMSLGFIPVELITSVPTIISCLAVALIPHNLPPELKTHDVQRLLDKNILMAHKQIKLGISSWSHDVPPAQAPAFPFSVNGQVQWSSRSDYKVSELCPNPLFFISYIQSVKSFQLYHIYALWPVPSPLIQAQFLFYLDYVAKITQMSWG